MGRPILLYSPGAVLQRDLPLALDPFDAALFLVPRATRVPLALLQTLGDVATFADDAVMSSTVLSRCRRFRPDGVVALSEDVLVPAAQLAEALGLPPLGDVAALTDKGVQRRLTRAGGSDSTRSILVKDTASWKSAVAELGLPVVLKPTHGAGSRHTVAVHHSATGASFLLDSRITTDGPFVAEELLRGRDLGRFGAYVSVESVVVDGHVHHLGVTGKLPQLPPFRETGQFHPAPVDLDENDEIEQLVTRVIRDVGVRYGATHTEVMLTTGGPRLIEINGRLGGYINELYTRVLGTNILTLAIRASCGEETHLPIADRSQVHFQYFHQPPLGVTRFSGVDGARELRRLDGLTRFDQLVEAGSRLPVDGRSLDLDLVCGRASSFQEMFRRLDAAHDALTFHFDDDNGSVVRSGRELAAPEPARSGLDGVPGGS